MLENIELGWGLYLILWFQSWRTPLITGLALIFHFIGSEAFFLPMLVMIYWCIDKHLGRRLLPLFLLSGWVNASIKSAFRRPRPYHVSPYVYNVLAETGYGLPSGHSQNSTLVGGVIANELRRWWILAVTIVYAALTGISRMILGVHYPQDVIVGITLGLLMLGVYGVISPRAEKWIARQTLAMQIALIVVAVAVMILIYPILIEPSSPLWLPTAIPTGELLSGPLIHIGLLLGTGIGLALEAHYLDFDSKGPIPHRIGRFVLGAVVIVGLYFALRPLRTLEPTVLFALIRYTAIGFWVTFGAPWVYLKIGLAERTRKPDPYAQK
jgi:membrane-associated phospholipid phosphatase